MMKLAFIHTSATYDHDSGGGSESVTVRVDDEGGGPFIVLETDGWSMDDRSEVDQLVQAIMRELEYAEARLAEESKT